MSFPFTQLPPDLQRLILDISPSLLRSIPELSSIGGTQVLQREFIQRVCNSPLSNREIRNYLSIEKPESFAVFRRFESRYYREYLGQHSRFPRYQRSASIYIISDDFPRSALDLRLGLNVSYLVPTEIGPTETLDLNSIYSIYRRRLSCLRYIPDLPKRKVLRIIEDVTDALDSDDLYRIGSAIIYIAINSILLGIPNYIPERIVTPITSESIQEFVEPAMDQLLEIRRLFESRID